MKPRLVAQLIWLLLLGLVAAAFTESLLLPDATDGEVFVRVTVPFFIGGLAGMWLRSMD